MSRTYNYSNNDDDIRKILTKVTDTVMSDTDVNYFIEMADNYIDSKLAFKYSVPFTSTPPIIKIISSHLAAYFVLRTLKIKTTEEEDSFVNKIKQTAIDLLNEIIEGETVLIDSDGDEVSTKSNYGIGSTTSGNEPVFDLGNEANWNISKRD